MLRGLMGSGLRLGALLRARPEFASLVTNELHDWLPGVLANPQSDLSVYLRENGFVPAFCVCHMRREGAPFAVPPLPFSPYGDGDYDAVQALVSRSFYELRRSMGILPHYIAPSDDVRAKYAQNAGDLFLLRQSGRVVGFVTAIGDTLDDLCVDEEHRGQGLGAALVMHGVNHILQKGRPAVRLDVIEHNCGALALYRKLGFTHEFTTYLYRDSGL